jgi:hypothetical protein
MQKSWLPAGGGVSTPGSEKPAETRSMFLHTSIFWADLPHHC